MKIFHPLLIVLILFFVLDVAAEQTGPRDPLTARDAGLYCGANDYFLRTDTPFDFFVVPVVAYEGQSNTRWNDWLQKARQSNKRIIADLIPQAKDESGQWYGITSLNAKSDPAKLDRLVKVIDEFFVDVEINDLYAITLGEEHVFWNDQAELLNRLYEKVKARHDVPVYQWFSPSSQGSIPGISGWPNLKSDGWVSDEYYLDQPLMERGMRGFRILQKPVVHIVWAGGKKNSVPFLPARFTEQIEVCRKYDIPTAFFTWYGEGGLWGWSEQSPESLKEKFNLVLEASDEAESLSPASRTTWDVVPWETPVIELGFMSHDDLVPGYQERYTEDRVLRFVNDAQITGFADLRWDSSPVELRPRNAGPAEASITYSFASPFPVTQLRVNVAYARPGKDAIVRVSILDSSGETVSTRKISRKRTGTINITLPGRGVRNGRFDVVLAMSGTAPAAGEVLAGIGSLEVEADVELPAEKVIELDPDDAGDITYEQDLRSMKIYHTAELKNVVKFSHSTSGMLANINPGVLEVVQKFRTPQNVKLTAVHIEGSANETSKYKARIGVGLSRDGTNPLAKTMSKGAFNGLLELDLSEVEDSGSNEFFIHLYLDGGFGVIKSYSLNGIASENIGR